MFSFCPVLSVLYRVSFSQANITTNVDQKGKGEVNQNGRTHGYERDVNEEQADFSRGNAQHLPEKRANTKSPYLQDGFYLVD